MRIKEQVASQFRTIILPPNAENNNISSKEANRAVTKDPMDIFLYPVTD